MIGAQTYRSLFIHNLIPPHATRISSSRSSMPEQTGTPGSNDVDDSSVTATTNAPKDKACPFCHQPFTSSSLGRHLDLYIKERNPKPADGVHDVVEIRKLRGGITRRQPRSSTSRREDSTPVGTPGINGNGRGRSPISEVLSGKTTGRDLTSPSVRNTPQYNSEDGRTAAKGFIHATTWHATGVMNNIPPHGVHGGESITHISTDNGQNRATAQRVVGKQMQQKVNMDQRQRLQEALETSRAAELALRELIGSLRAAG